MPMAHGFQQVVFDESTAATFVILDVNTTSGRRVRIRGLFLSAVGVQLVTLQSNGNSIGAVHLVAGGVANLSIMGGGVGERYMEVTAGEELRITLGQAVQTDGIIYYDFI